MWSYSEVSLVLQQPNHKKQANSTQATSTISLFDYEWLYFFNPSSKLSAFEKLLDYGSFVGWIQVSTEQNEM